MTRFNLGVFIDASHVLVTDKALRKAHLVLDRIEMAASAFCMATGISHGVVVADCADLAIRQVAEDFGEHGFRIRHVPVTHKADTHQVIAAEIMEAMTTRPGLQAIAVVSDQEAYLPLVDPLHRAGCALIGCTAGATGEFGGVDEVITLPLTRGELRDLVRGGLEELADRGTSETSIVGLEQAMRRIDPGYSARAYNVSVKRVLQQIQEPWFSFNEPDRINFNISEWPGDSASNLDLVDVSPMTVSSNANGRESSHRASRSRHRSRSRPGQVLSQPEVVEICRSLPPLDEDADWGATVGALRAILNLLAESPNGRTLPAILE